MDALINTTDILWHVLEIPWDNKTAIETMPFVFYTHARRIIKFYYKFLIVFICHSSISQLSGKVTVKCKFSPRGDKTFTC